MYEKVYELPWEVGVLKNFWKKRFNPQIGKGSKVKITGAVSENIKVRQKIKRKNRRHRIQMLGAKPEDTFVYLCIQTGIFLDSLKRCFGDEGSAGRSG